jgi:hypothetical protein
MKTASIASWYALIIRRSSVRARVGPLESAANHPAATAPGVVAERKRAIPVDSRFRRVRCGRPRALSSSGPMSRLPEIRRRGGGRFPVNRAGAPRRRCCAATFRLRTVLRVAAGSVTVAMCLATTGAAVASRWSIQAAARPADTRDSELSGVSCVSRTACTAVGYLTNRNGTGLTLAERWNGAVWSIGRTPNRAVRSGLLGGLQSVSCSSATGCTATGAANARTLAERWDGLSWSTEATPNPAFGDDLEGVSCPSATSCTAVGWVLTGATLAERWNGVTWSIEPTAKLAGETDNTLYGVSCASVTSCIAVGNASSRTSGTRSLSEQWNGIAWSADQTPQLAGERGSDLFSVSCSSVTSCTAVGDHTPRAGGTLPLAERWIDGAWSIQQAASPAHAKDIILSGVSCATATVCTAVGNFTRAGSRLPLAERWTNGAWSIQPTPSPAHAKDIVLSAISCATPTICTAVGSFATRGGITLPLVEHQ